MAAPFRFLVCLATSLAPLAFSGCNSDDAGDESTVENAAPFAGAHVRILVPKAADDSAAWDLFLNEWSALSKASVDVAAWDDVSDVEAALKEKPDDGTVIFFPAVGRAELASRDLFSSLPRDLQSVEALDWHDVHRGVSENVLEWDGEPAFLPIRLPLLVLYYRRDLLDAAGLAPPQSWTEYRNLLETLADWAPGLTAVEPWSPSFRTSLFLARSLSLVKLEGNYSVFWDYTTGKPLIDSPGFVRGLERALDDVRLLDPNSLEMTPDDCLASIADGKSAIAIAAAFPDITREFGPKVAPSKFEIAVVPLPGSEQVYDPGRGFWVDSSGGEVNRATLTGWDGMLAGVAATGDETARRAAWNLLQSLTRDFGADAFPQGGMTPSRLSASSRPFPMSVAGLNVRSHAEAVRDAQRDAPVVPELSIRNHESFRTALRTELDLALAGDESAQEALSAVAGAWNVILDERGRDELRDSYAGGLGIPLP